ncbi:unnamed protein product [Trifolium pratense]|uniref:Uncharacterized protein n=1 Tax=Trifolium pratense TaxID=57577 RepID=A0ACB0JUS0_TRIPR|nr:unnamed protein product [Trifolium pratense]
MLDMLESHGLSLPSAIVDALDNTDNIYQPIARAFANFIASKISSLTDVEIARLTNNEISRLIQMLPEAEIRRLVNDEISRLSDVFTAFGEGVTRQHYIDLIMLFLGLVCFTFINAGLIIFQCYQESSKHAAIVTTNATQKRPKPSMKPILKYPGTPDLKGLKGIAETYSQEKSTGLRQLVEERQEGKSRVVVRSKRSIVDPKSLSR